VQQVAALICSPSLVFKGSFEERQHEQETDSG
jgi:hypothetical protein